MNLLTNSHNPISSLYKYKNIILYIVKSSLNVYELVHKYILCLSLAHLIIEPKLKA